MLVLLLAVTAGAQDIQDKNLGIIPAPASVVIKGGVFELRKIKAIVYKKVGEAEARLLHDFLLANYALDIPVTNKPVRNDNNSIVFSDSYQGTNREGYRLAISNNAVTIDGKGAGLFYGLQSLLQVMQASRGERFTIPCALIDDEPRYPYRGIMQDVGYHIFPLEFIRKQIDLMAKYKMNVYHWHLTEDHGWRIEIKKYPKLTTIGSVRAQSPVNNYDDNMSGLDGTPYGGFYTQEEVKGIVAYAAARHITVIPEIELPGHSVAALAAYPELACGDNPGPFKVAEHWGIYDDVYCAGKDKTFAFLEDVLLEVMELFPAKYIHIGGDECPKDRWEKCKYCQQRIKDNKLKNEHELQSYFIRRIERFVNSKGRSIIGWDEILEGGLAPNATVMAWRGVDAGVESAKQGHDVVMSPTSNLYFDFIQGPRELEPLAIGFGSNPLWRVYSFNPTPDELTPAQQKHILGVEAPLWTEHMETPGNVEYFLFPRMFALAEIGWTPQAGKDYTNFTESRLPKHLALLDKTGTVYRVPTPIGQKDTTVWGKEFTVALKAPVDGATIYYNFEGQDPREADYAYKAPIHVIVPEGEMRQLKTIVVAPSGKRSIVTTTTFVNKPPVKAATIDRSTLSPGLSYFFIPGKSKDTDCLGVPPVKSTGIVTMIDMRKLHKKEDHALLFKGYVEMATDGVYSFSLPSEGTDILIDGEAGIRNSNIEHTYGRVFYPYREKTLSWNLQKGLHAIEIRYLPVNAGHRVQMAAPGEMYRDLEGKIYTGR